MGLRGRREARLRGAGEGLADELDGARWLKLDSVKRDTQLQAAAEASLKRSLSRGGREA